MGQTNYLKILWIVLYILFAAISCVVTEESLYLSFPTYSEPMCWIITIGFYIIASLGGSLLLDSFARNPIISFIDVKHHRTACMTIGAIILILFWLVFSMPTNTHTFIFHNQIDKTISTDVTATMNYLNQLQAAKVSEEKIAHTQDSVKNAIDATSVQLRAEINNSSMPGYGPKADSIRDNLQNLLKVKFDKLRYDGDTSQEGRARLSDAYAQKIRNMRDTRLQNIRREMLGQDRMRDHYVADATVAINNLKAWQKARIQGQVSVSDANDIRNLQKCLSEGYAIIKNYKDFVDFSSNPQDKERYTGDVQTTRIERLISVLDTWKDFLTGKFGANLAMVFCIFLAILIDLAAFIFFYLIQK